MRVFFFIFVFILSSCASYQNGRQAVDSTNGSRSSKSGVLVTAYQDHEFSTPHFSYIQVEFGNKTNDWYEVEKVLLKYYGKDIQIILGPRLVDWSKSIRNKVAVDRQNTQALLGALAATAAIGAVSSAHNGKISSTKTYLTVMSGTAVADSVNTLSNKISDLERAQIFPDNHLYAPFSVPPGLVSKRWILLQHAPGAIIQKLVFEVYLKNGSKRTYSVTI